ncbi:hypothetical protein JX266_014312 [Neoarthrinium moseri]|nr:hypothetical protein JX266_014312 [Neoarthrinium moseri]
MVFDCASIPLQPQGPVAYLRLYHDEAAPDQLQVGACLQPLELEHLHRLVLAPSPDFSLLLADEPFQALDCLLQLVYFILRIFHLLPQPRQLVVRRALFHVPLIDFGVFLDLGHLIVDGEAQKVAPCTAISATPTFRALSTEDKMVEFLADEFDAQVTTMSVSRALTSIGWAGKTYSFVEVRLLVDARYPRSDKWFDGWLVGITTSVCSAF